MKKDWLFFIPHPSSLTLPLQPRPYSTIWKSTRRVAVECFFPARVSVAMT
jgi:hypothetical protein